MIKILTKLKILIAALFIVSNLYGMLTQNDPNVYNTSLDSQHITQSIPENENTASSITREVENLTTATPLLTASNRGRDYAPFLRSIGVTQNIDKVIESCKFLEDNYLTPEQIAQADMEVFSPDRTPIKSVYSWKSAGWGLAQWLVGTSQNFAYITIVVCAVVANILPDKAVCLATTSGAVAGVGALLSKMYTYCKNKRLNSIAYNMVLMAAQAAIQERTEAVLSSEEDSQREADTDL